MEKKTDIPQTIAASTPAWWDRYGRVLAGIALAVVVVCLAVRFANLQADPSLIEKNKTSDLFGDPGLWYSPLFWQHYYGEWRVPKDQYNPYPIVPLMPTLVYAVKEVTGLDTWVAVRGTTAAVGCLGILAVMLALWRSRGPWAGLLAGLLLATSFHWFIWCRVGS